MLREGTCVVYLSLLVGIHGDKYSNQRAPKPLVLVNECGKGRANTRWMDVLNPLISSIDHPEVLLVVGVVDMITSHLGIKEICLLMCKKQKMLGLRLSRNCLRHNFSK